MKYGCHVSIRNGYYSAAVEAKRKGADSFQMFPKNPRSISIKDFDRSDAERCASFCHENHLSSVVHTPYPTSLVPKESERDQMKDSILNDLEIAEACGAIGIVVHFGVAKTEDPLDSYKQMIQFLNDVLSDWDGECLLLIENNAGKSGRMGTTLEESVQVRRLTEYPEKIGFCLDTCHLFASGIWNGDNWTDIEENGRSLGYFESLKAVHLNNSRYPSGSMKDRHANIGNGEITTKQMSEFLASPYVNTLPLILETPDSQTYTHEQELKDVRTWFEAT